MTATTETSPPPAAPVENAADETAARREAIIDAILSREYLGDLAGRIAAQCRTVCPVELPQDRGLYVLWQSQLPDLAGASSCYGLTTPTLDLIGRQASAIAPENWRGRGGAFMLADRVTVADIIADAGAGPANVLRSRFESWIIPAALHELAHIIERDWFAPSDPVVEKSPDRVKFAGLMLGGWMKDRETAERDVSLHWRGHNLRFVRTLCHLAIRSEFRVSLAGMFAGTLLPSHPSAYLAALGPEPEFMAGRSFKEILATTPPKQFVRLYAEDTKQDFEELMKNATAPSELEIEPTTNLAGAAHADVQIHEFVHFLMERGIDPNEIEDSELDRLKKTFQEMNATNH